MFRQATSSRIIQAAHQSIVVTIPNLNRFIKFQGSEFPVVILPLYMQHQIILSRNLLYTELTRAKKLAIIIGSNKAISLAVKQIKEQRRYTRLFSRMTAVSLDKGKVINCVKLATESQVLSKSLRGITLSNFIL